VIEVTIQIRKFGDCRPMELTLTTQEFISLRNIFNALTETEEIKVSRFTEDDLTEILKAIFEE
jgi:hypothetical protein